MKKISIFLSFTAFAAFAQPKVTYLYPEDDLITSYRKSYLSQEIGFPLREDANLMLYDTITTWLGTPYKFAGNCEKGIDCSGFVNVLFDRVYGKHIGARNSAEIFEQVHKIDKHDIREGDMVFFRIHKRRISHIGLYLGDNKFVHASTSRGVIISDLNDPYYKKYFAGAGRLKTETADSNDQP
ncbi:MAG: C40 family peptidase [Bacteroidia bacterium]|nr:C40 family peptidase [Bacteroidia bacterium]